MSAWIHTITPNPALDLGGIVKKIVPNEKVYVHHPTLYPGGNGVNAARIAHRLGGRVQATGFIAGGTGEEVRAFLDREGVAHEFIRIEGMTRISVTVTTEGTPLQTRLSFPGPTVSSRDIRALQAKAHRFARSSILVIGGSVPAGLSPVAIRSLVSSANRRGLISIVDMPGPLLREVIASRPFFIKPNLTEFQELTGRKVSSKLAVLKEMRRLNPTVPLICVSSVEGGAILASSDEAWFGRIPDVRIRTTVGAGDSMVGAIAHRLSLLSLPERKKPDLSDLLGWGLAASCATLVRVGTTLGTAADIRRFRGKISLQRLP